MAESLPSLLAFGLLYVVLPFWMLAGLADFACHRDLRIEHNAGLGESLLHLLMLAELAVAILAPLFLDLTATVFAVMLIGCIAHEVTMCVDLAYATSRRRVPWFEQWVHGLQQAMPWAWISGWMLLGGPQALALLGLGDAVPDWGLRAQVAISASGVSRRCAGCAALLVWLPFVYECWRCRQAACVQSEQRLRQPGRIADAATSPNPCRLSRRRATASAASPLASQPAPGRRWRRRHSTGFGRSSPSPGGQSSGGRDLRHGWHRGAGRLPAVLVVRSSPGDHRRAPPAIVPAVRCLIGFSASASACH